MKSVSETFQKSQPNIVEEHKIPTSNVADVKHISGGFTVQTNRIMDDTISTMKVRGMYKIRVQNKGQVAVKIFGSFDLPSYADETFESGDSILGFTTDAQIEYAPHSPVDSINIVVTGYTRVL